MRRMARRGRPALAGWTPGGLALVAMIVMALAACGGGSGATVSCASSGAVVCTKVIQLDGTSRSALASPQGKTLYAYKPDTSTTAACAGPCAVAWPPLTASGSVPSSLDGLSGTLGVLSGDNGAQVVYNGHPLYTYSLDGGVQDARGQGAEGGAWSVVTPDIAPLGAPSQIPAAPTPTSPQDPYGY